MTRKYGLLIFGLAKRVKNVIFYSNDVETWVTYSTQGDFYVFSLIPIVKKNVNQFFLWRPWYFVFQYLYSHFKKKIFRICKIFQQFCPLYICAYYCMNWPHQHHRLIWNTTPWISNSFEHLLKSIAGHIFFYYLELELVLFFLYF